MKDIEQEGIEKLVGMEYYYTADQLKQNLDPSIADKPIHIKFSQGQAQTKWMDLNEQKAEVIIAWLTEHFLSDRLSDKLWTLIDEAVHICGSYDPIEVLSRIEERLTWDELKIVKGFLTYVHDNNLAFGHGNYQQRFKEYKNSLK